MAAIDNALINMEDDIKNAQAIKNTILQKMFDEGDISKELVEKWSKEFQIVIIKKEWWRDWKSIFGGNSGYHYKILKV